MYCAIFVDVRIGVRAAYTTLASLTASFAPGDSLFAKAYYSLDGAPAAALLMKSSAATTVGANGGDGHGRPANGVCDSREERFIYCSV